MATAKLCLLSMLMLVAGCATQPNKVADDGPDVQCHSEQTTGSLITKSVCTTRAQRVALQAQLNEVKQAAQADAGTNPRPASPSR